MLDMTAIKVKDIPIIEIETYNEAGQEAGAAMHKIILEIAGGTEQIYISLVHSQCLQCRGFALIAMHWSRESWCC